MTTDLREPHRVYVTCERCRGTGGPDDYFDEQIGRWQSQVCSSCSGSGHRYEWRD